MNADLATYAEAINKAWNSHDIEKVMRFYSPDYIGEGVGQPSPLRGLDIMRTMLEHYWRAFPDLKFNVIRALVDGSRIAILWIGEGTQDGAIMSIPPNG